MNLSRGKVSIRRVADGFEKYSVYPVAKPAIEPAGGWKSEKNP
jgi:hypothetical protein